MSICLLMFFFISSNATKEKLFVLKSRMFDIACEQFNADDCQCIRHLLACDYAMDYDEKENKYEDYPHEKEHLLDEFKIDPSHPYAHYELRNKNAKQDDIDKAYESLSLCETQTRTFEAHTIKPCDSVCKNCRFSKTWEASYKFTFSIENFEKEINLQNLKIKELEDNILKEEKTQNDNNTIYLKDETELQLKVDNADIALGIEMKENAETQIAQDKSKEMEEDYEKKKTNFLSENFSNLAMQEQLKKFPIQQFQEDPIFNHHANIGILGCTKAGKSLFVTTILKMQEETMPNGNKMKQIKNPVVHGKEGTLKPTPYNLNEESDNAIFWDLPGYGTDTIPLKTYFINMGLFYFDLVIIITADMFDDGDIQMMKILQKNDRPFIMVRNKMDITLDKLFKKQGHMKKNDYASELIQQIQNKESDELTPKEKQREQSYLQEKKTIQTEFNEKQKEMDTKQEMFFISSHLDDKNVFDMQKLFKKIMESMNGEKIQQKKKTLKEYKEKLFVDYSKPNHEELSKIQTNHSDNITPLTPPAWFANLDQEDKDKMVALLSQALNQYESFGSVKQDLIEKFQIKDFQAEELYKFVYYSQL